MIRATFKRIETKHSKDPIRSGDEPIAGFFNEHPKEGEGFLFMADVPMVPGTQRMIHTSVVKKIEKYDDEYVIWTRNSTYSVKIRGEGDA